MVELRGAAILPSHGLDDLRFGDIGEKVKGFFVVKRIVKQDAGAAIAAMAIDLQFIAVSKDGLDNLAGKGLHNATF